MSLMLPSHGPSEPIRNAILARLLSDAARAFEREPERARQSLLRAVALVGEAPTPAPDARRRHLALWQAKKTLAAIDEHIADGPRISGLAAHLELSPSHFSRAFKEFFGRSPQQFILERRVEHAKGLLIATEDRLCDIAQACGFADQAHFSRVFHRATGAPPNAWRRARARA